MSKPSIRCGALREPELPAELLGDDLAAARPGQEMGLEGERRVLLGHRDQLALPAALGDEELDAAVRGAAPATPRAAPPPGTSVESRTSRGGITLFE